MKENEEELRKMWKRERGRRRTWKEEGTRNEMKKGRGMRQCRRRARRRSEGRLVKGHDGRAFKVAPFPRL